jgi:hypothetical protein
MRASQLAERLDPEGGGGFNPRVCHKISVGFSPGGKCSAEFDLEIPSAILTEAIC